MEDNVKNEEIQHIVNLIDKFKHNIAYEMLKGKHIECYVSKEGRLKVYNLPKRKPIWLEE